MSPDWRLSNPTARPTIAPMPSCRISTSHRGELFPEGELRFFSKTSDDVVVFEVDSEGKVKGLVIQRGGRSIPVRRAN